jgi:hypothetical protein
VGIAAIFCTPALSAAVTAAVLHRTLHFLPWRLVLMAETKMTTGNRRKVQDGRLSRSTLQDLDPTVTPRGVDN